MLKQVETYCVFYIYTYEKIYFYILGTIMFQHDYSSEKYVPKEHSTITSVL